MPKTKLPRLLLFAGIAVASATATLLLTADRMPDLTSDHLASARARWRQAAAHDYDLRLEMEGSRLDKGLYTVRVRADRVSELSRDGIAVTGDGTPYTIPGLFDLLGQELELAATPSRSYGAPAGYGAYLMASFDRASGIPTRFRRVVGGTDNWVEWRVVEFAPR